MTLLVGGLSGVAAAQPAAAESAPVPAESAPVPAESAPGTAESEAVPAESQPAAVGSDAATAESQPAPAAPKKETSFAVVPGPFYNPSLGLGINVIPMLMFHPDESDDASPASIAMLNLLYAVKPPFDEAGSRRSGTSEPVRRSPTANRARSSILRWAKTSERQRS